MLFGPGIIPPIGPMGSVHGGKTAQVGHPLALQGLQMRVVFFPWARIINLVQEEDSDPGEVIRRVTVTL